MPAGYDGVSPQVDWRRAPSKVTVVPAVFVVVTYVNVYLNSILVMGWNL